MLNWLMAGILVFNGSSNGNKPPSVQIGAACFMLLSFVYLCLDLLNGVDFACGVGVVLLLRLTRAINIL